MPPAEFDLRQYC